MAFRAACLKLRDDKKKEKSCETLPVINILISGKTLRRERVDSISVELSVKGEGDDN